MSLLCSEALKLIFSIFLPISCHPFDDILERPFGSTKLSVEQYWRRESCKELFSEEMPKWMNLSQENLSHIPVDWWPLCSLTIIQKQRRDDPKRFLNEYLARHNDEVTRLDACVQKKSNRYVENYYPPTQSESKLTKIMSEMQKQNYKTNIRKVQSKLVNMCCGSDQSCARYVNNVDIQWCEPQTDPDKPDPCTDGATYRFYFFPPKSSYMVVAPFLTKEGLPLVSLSSAIHELSHACSAARTVSRLYKKGSVDEYVKFRLLDKRNYEQGEPLPAGCELKDAYIDMYRAAFIQAGANSKTFECLKVLAEGATETRFQKGSCPKGCPLQYLEESLAGWFALRLGSTSDQINYFLRTCYGVRDSEHPLNLDVLRCFLKTPKMKRSIEILTQCK